MGKRIPIVITEHLQSDLPEDKMSPQDRDTAADEHKANPQPPSVVDKNSSSKNKEQPGYSEEDNSSDKKAMREFFWREPITGQWFFNGVVALFTVLTCYVTYLQYTAQLLDQRAWVGPTTFRIPKMKPSVKTSFEAAITNSGKTPALKVKAGITAATWRKGGAFLPLYSVASTKTLIQTGTLFPGAISTTGTESRTLTPEEVRLLENGDQVLYIYGRIEYWDIFNYPHCTTFCFSLLNDLETMAYCPTYNQANDAECEK